MAKKIIIIGGGVAGLSAGIYGQMHGFETKIIEMHKITGGQCTAWDRKGYRFDYCLHWLVGSKDGPFRKIWEETNVINENVKIINHDVHTKFVDENGEEFYIYTNIDKWEAYLKNIAPEDSKSISKMCNDMRKGRKLEPFEDAPGLRKVGSFLKSSTKIFPLMGIFMKYAKKSCQDYFNELDFQSPRLKKGFSSFFGSRDFSAIAFIMMLAWFDTENAGYLIGGSLPFAQRMEEKFLSTGGKLTVGKRVEKILVNDSKATGVKLSDGTEKYADYVISAADGYATIFKMLEGKFVSKEIENAYQNWELFTPLVQVSLGINKKIMSSSNVTTYIGNNLKFGKSELKSGYSVMNYNYDPTMAPDGKTTMVIRFESPWEIWENLEGESYKAEKKQIEQDVIEALEKHYPGISQHIEVVDVATPKTDVKYTGVYKGAYEGFMPTSKNFNQSLKMTLPGLSNFYMIGQWLYPGGGLPPAAQSGKWVMQYICKEEGMDYK